MDENPEIPSDVMPLARSSAQSYEFADRVRDQSTLITPAPELRMRNAAPEPVPQDNGQSCQQESQSASQAIQQASQSVQQASQQASQSVQQAQQSASRAIQQAQNDVSQSLQQVSRSVSSVQSSASSAISSLQSSASSALQQASSSAAQMAASAQVAASRAVVQAGAAIAAATGNGAAAASAFLAKATQNTPTHPNTSSPTSAAQQQRGTARSSGITPTQLAIAIVGSIIASVLLSVLLFYLVMRHKKNARDRADPPTPMANQGAPMEKSDYRGLGGSTTSLALSPRASGGLGSDDVKRTSLAWNPSHPPKVPKIGGWLKAPEGVSPVGSIRLPSEGSDKGPLGGQLKSPMRTVNFESPTLGEMNPFKSFEVSGNEPNPISTAPKRTLTSTVSVRKLPNSTRPPSAIPAHMSRDIRPVSRTTSSIWSDNVPGTATPQQPLSADNPATDTKLNHMQLPPMRGPIRNTADWLAAQSVGTPIATPLATPQISRYQLGVPVKAGPAIMIKTVKVAGGQGDSLSRSGSVESTNSVTSVKIMKSDLGVKKVDTPGRAM